MSSVIPNAARQCPRLWRRQRLDAIEERRQQLVQRGEAEIASPTRCRRGAPRRSRRPTMPRTRASTSCRCLPPRGRRAPHSDRCRACLTTRPSSACSGSRPTNEITRPQSTRPRPGPDHPGSRADPQHFQAGDPRAIEPTLGLHGSGDGDLAWPVAEPKTLAIVGAGPGTRLGARTAVRTGGLVGRAGGLAPGGDRRRPGRARAVRGEHVSVPEPTSTDRPRVRARLRLDRRCPRGARRRRLQRIDLPGRGGPRAVARGAPARARHPRRRRAQHGPVRNRGDAAGRSWRCSCSR